MYVKKKITYDQIYVPLSMMKGLIKETDIPSFTIEEMDSELITETLNGKGKIIFHNNDEYDGDVKYGVLDSDMCVYRFKDTNIVYEGEMRNNQISGKGKFLFQNSNSRYNLFYKL